ncbi:MAG: hypothetical protein RLZZ450_7460 [Pseudomonadota bacterium]|jgi:hypothetical protein
MKTTVSSATKNRVVWVLGSGFSRSIGGPLLNELMGQARWDRIKQIPEFVHRVPMWEKLLWYWNTYNGKPSAQWTDAEEFVEWIELMSTGAIPLDAQLANQFPGQKPSFIADACRKYLAAVTYEFTANAQPDFERWQPYRSFAALLQPQDHVMSFNYDQVLEKAFVAATGGEQIRVTLTSDKPGQLNKVHGSVDWTLGQDAQIIVQDPIFAIASPAEQVIGIPGPNKMSSCGTILQPQWQASLAALREADIIVFMGYRFPPSDSYARHFILDAIKNNSAAQLTMRIVLGPQRDEHVIRLEALLNWAVRRRNDSAAVIHEPMWAQDFMAVFQREYLAEH